MMDGKLHHNTRDLTGRRFGALVALKRSHTNGKKWLWVYECDCGNECAKVGADVSKELKRGGTPNCGCLTARLQSKPKTHGMSRHPAYAVWRSMCDRCRLPSHQAWKNYGARGITVCTRWQESFENFWADMGPAYAEGLTLDREDNDKGYSPQNCRWVTMRVQANNRRENHIIETPWGAMTVSQAARRAGINHTTILYRIAAGWPTDQLLREPHRSNRVRSTT